MLITVGTVIFDDRNEKYLLKTAINQGGFGMVYKAVRESDGELFAVKTLPNNFIDEKSVLSFKKELQQSLIVNSEHVIKYYYINDGVKQPNFPPYIIMEFADGGSLNELIEQHKSANRLFSNAELLNIFSQLADGMKSINEKLVHRDIKPQNILINQGKMKISDFGLSKLSLDSTQTMTFKGYGTKQYIAPEAWKNEENTIQMDIYSMGVVFYELATLSYPYSIQTESIEEYRKAHLMSAPINPSRFNEDLSPELVSVIIRMLEKSTKKRFMCWEDIIKHLKPSYSVSSKLELLVKEAIRKKNDNDLVEQQIESERTQIELKKKEHIEFIEAQFSNEIVEPLKEFADKFNNKYSGDKKMHVMRRGIDKNERFTYDFCIGEKKISFECEILLKENHKKEISDYWGNSREVEYIPELNHKPVLLWSYVASEQGLGFNLFLLKSEESDYGDWVVLENQCNGLFFCEPSDWRPGKFGFDLYELPEMINELNCISRYTSTIVDFQIDYVITYITDNM